MDALPLIAIVLIFVLVHFLASVRRVRRAWVYAEPFRLEPFDLTQISPMALSRVRTISTALASLGYHSIGVCRWDVNDHLSRAYAIWIRQNTIAEIAMMGRPSNSEPTISVAFGEEYTDGSSIVVRNSRNAGRAKDVQFFSLPGLMDISILEEVSQTIITKYRMNRLPWIPSDAIEYKRRDVNKWCEDVVKSGSYRLNRKTNQLRATFRLLRRTWLSSIKKYTPVHVPANDVLRANYLLRALGYPDLATLSGRRVRAFPVITDPTQRQDLSSPAASQPQPPQT